AAARKRLGDLYGVRCDKCGNRGELTKAVWSSVVRCRNCSGSVNYYRALETAGWSKSAMVCPYCEAPVDAKLDRVDEEPVSDSITCLCSPRQLEQPPKKPGPAVAPDDFNYPKVEITPDRVMYQAQSLGKSGLTTVASFYSPRNLVTLTVLHEEICKVS